MWWIYYCNDSLFQALYGRHLDVFQFFEYVSPLIQEASSVLTNWRGILTQSVLGACWRTQLFLFLSFFSHKLATTKTVEHWWNTYTTWYRHHYTIGWQTLVEARTNHQNSYKDINKTILLDPTNSLKLMISNHNNVLKKNRYFYSTPLLFWIIGQSLSFNVLPD